MTSPYSQISPVRPEFKFPENFVEIMEKRWSLFENVCAEKKLSVPDSPDVISTIRNVFALSEFVARRCAQHPDLLISLVETGDLKRKYEDADYVNKIRKHCIEASDLTSLSDNLRRIRIREMVRIACRELAGWADLSETMINISTFAAASLEISLSILYQWLCKEHGVPKGKNGEKKHLVVIGLGKLGGMELNFSSDIDLMFAFPEAGQTENGKQSISNEQFFTRLCHRLIDIVGKQTTDGFVFRVDTRLRPYGESGPIVMSFDAMESYYQQQGREWERYALIKARIVAGDKFSGEQLLDRLQPFVFRKYLDYGTFESLREMKEKIAGEIKRKGLKGNIKLGAGGIREIEFFGQMFQLIRGGIYPKYQERSILKVLRLLAMDNYISEIVCNELLEGYVFLRNVENRLQMFNDLQTHILPENELEQQRLALSMGHGNWGTFFSVLEAHVNKVHSHFNELLRKDESDTSLDVYGQLLNDVWLNLADTEQSLEIIGNLGFDPPGETYEVLKLYKEIVESEDISIHGRKRMNRLVPLLLKEAFSAEDANIVLKRIFELMKSIRRRSSYMALLIENPESLSQLVTLANASPWIISFLSTHPLLLDELLYVGSLSSPLGKYELRAELNSRLSRKQESDLESQMDDLRVFKQINTFRIAAADVIGLVPLMKVSDGLTFLAETILDKVLEMSWDHLVDRYGTPSGDLQTGKKGFAIIAYGKLGGIELGYGSDLDLVFLHTGTKGYTTGGRMNPMDNSQFYVRLGQRIIHFLTTLIDTGKLYETDMRLRPSGSGGVLVSQMEAFYEYQMKQAWTWEHQALIKARAVSGDMDVGDRFWNMRRQILSFQRDPSELREAVCDMRARLQNEFTETGTSMFDLKHDPGGIIDIEFIVQYLILLNANKFPELAEWTDVVRQLHSLALAGIIDDRTAYILKQAYLVFRYYNHRLSLQGKPAIISVDRFPDLREKVTQIWKRYL